MKYWAITKGLDDTFEFHQVEGETMTEALKQVEGGIAIVSSYFKRKYSKYVKLWNKLNKYYDELDDNDMMWDSAYLVLNEVLGKDAILWGKNSLLMFDDTQNIDIYSLSDYQFEQLILILEKKCSWVK